MLIVCPSCATSYRVETACFGEAGRLVRCVRCGDVWLGTESLLVAAMIAENEQAEIAAASAPDCDVEPQELPTPDPSYCLICECYPDSAVGADDPTSTDRMTSWLSRLARREGLWAGGALFSPSPPP